MSKCTCRSVSVQRIFRKNPSQCFREKRCSQLRHKRPRTHQKGRAPSIQGHPRKKEGEERKERERERERASESEGGREGGRGGKKWRKAEMMQQFMMRALPGRVCACHPYFARKEPLDKQVCPCLLNFGVLIRFLRAAQIANAKDSSIQLALQLERLFN